MAETTGSPQTITHQTGPAISLWLGLVLSLAAAAITWGVVQGVHPVFRVDKKFDVPSIGLPPAMFAAHRRQQDSVDRLHAMLYLSLLGLNIAVVLGVGEGIARRAWQVPLYAAPLGIIGGALGGLFAPLVYEYVRANIGQLDLKYYVGAQLLVAVPLGICVGLGLGMATGTPRGTLNAALAGAGAGILAGVLFPVAVSMLFPAASTEALLPDEGEVRLFWLALLAGTVGLVIPIAGRRRRQARSHG